MTSPFIPKLYDPTSELGISYEIPSRISPLLHHLPGAPVIPTLLLPLDIVKAQFPTNGC